MVTHTSYIWRKRLIEIGIWQNYILIDPVVAMGILRIRQDKLAHDQNLLPSVFQLIDLPMPDEVVEQILNLREVPFLLGRFRFVPAQYSVNI